MEPKGDIPTLDKEFDIAYPMLQLKITPEIVEKKLSALDPCKSNGPDGMHPKILKELANCISRPLCKLFNKSIEEGIVPKDWKKAKITAIFKKGKKKDPSNYRPVSLTSVICKVLEGLVREHLSEFMKTNKLLSPKQYGFIKGRSTTLQLLKVLDDWTRSLEKGKQIDTIYMDFKKAFDTVPHWRLIGKLKSSISQLS